MAESSKVTRRTDILERTLFASRWLLAPFYLGLVLALVMLLVVFVREIIHEIPLVLTMSPEQGILVALSLIDLSLAANLLLIVIFSGYENFVSKLHAAEGEDRPDWMGTVDFSGLKMKLIASIVAISAISLLKSFMTIAYQPGEALTAITPSQGVTIGWQIGIHITFVVSGVLLALMDWLRAKAKGSPPDS